jgi:type VI protein secretion system component VasF
VNEQLLRLYIWQMNLRSDYQPRLAPRFGPRRDEAGEGVISAAIAVLIMAFLGVLVWGGFKLTLESTQTKVDQQVDKIGK